ncbi:MAG: ankyrin repeat protein [Chlamydiales bacterium]|jgi:ankyrin repeat protein
MKRKVFEGKNIVETASGTQNEKILEVIFKHVEYFPKDMREKLFLNNFSSSYLHESLDYGWDGVTNAILENYKEFPEKVQEQFFSLNKRGKTVMHLASIQFSAFNDIDFTYVEQLLSISKELPPKFQISLLSPDLQEEETLVDIAYKMGRGDIVYQILNNIKSYPAELQKTLLVGDNSKNPILHGAVKNHLYGVINKVSKEFPKYPIIIQELLLKPDSKGNTFLHIAADLGHLNFLGKTLDLLPNFSEETQNALFAHNKQGRSPLHFLARNNFTDMMNQTLKATLKLSSKFHRSLFFPKKSTYNILHYTAMKSDLDTFKLILEEVNSFPQKIRKGILGRDREGNSILHHALVPSNKEARSKDQLKIARYLLKDRVAIPAETRKEFYFPNNRGDTILQYATDHSEKHFGRYRQLSKVIIKDYLRNSPALFSHSLDYNEIGYSPLNQKRLGKMMTKYLSRLSPEQFTEILHGLRINAK